MDVKQYRQQLEEQLEHRAQTRPDPQGFWDRSEPIATRVAALESFGPVDEQDELNRFIEVIHNEDEDVRVRLAALNKIGGRVEHIQTLVDVAVALLQDQKEAAELRMAALLILQRSSFRGPKFAPKRPEYLSALRAVVEDKDSKLRQRAIGILAKHKDGAVQQRLVEGLKDRSKALVSPAKAIQFLGYDIHAEHYPLLKQIVKDPPNRAAKKEAVRWLASDTSSKELLIELFTDKTEDPEVRSVSAVALQSLAPADFEAYAKRIALDDSEDEKLRATCVNALSHFANPASLREDAGFSQRLAHVQGQTASKQLREASGEYLTKYGT